MRLPTFDGGRLPTAPGAGEGALDPVCGMTVDPGTSAHRFEHEGTTYHFCCEHCLVKFRDDLPKSMLGKVLRRELRE